MCNVNPHELTGVKYGSLKGGAESSGGTFDDSGGVMFAYVWENIHVVV